MSDYYILNGHEPVPVEDVREWAQKYGDWQGRRVAVTKVGEADVSTVFLGLDHSFGYGPPLLFETMIFGGPHTDNQWRYSTWDEAEAHHQTIVAALRDGRDPPDWP